jgi:two-component system chemotaxis response regulator CheB
MQFRRNPLFPESPFDLVVVVASLGGVTAIRELIRGLPADFPSPIAIVQHISPLSSMLARVFDGSSRLPVTFARHDERLRARHVYIAPVDRHLAVTKQGHLELLDSPKVNFVRPAADVLLESASAVFGPRLMAVVLTGMGTDGVRGVEAVKREGGIVIVQDPAGAQAPSMPMAALHAGCADLMLDLDGIANAIISLAIVGGAREWLGLPRIGPPLNAYA